MAMRSRSTPPPHPATAPSSPLLSHTLHLWLERSLPVVLATVIPSRWHPRTDLHVANRIAATYWHRGSGLAHAWKPRNRAGGCAPRPVRPGSGTVMERVLVESLPLVLDELVAPRVRSRLIDEVPAAVVGVARVAPHVLAAVARIAGASSAWSSSSLLPARRAPASARRRAVGVPPFEPDCLPSRLALQRRHACRRSARLGVDVVGIPGWHPARDRGDTLSAQPRTPSTDVPSRRPRCVQQVAVSPRPDRRAHTLPSPRVLSTHAAAPHASPRAPFTSAPLRTTSLPCAPCSVYPTTPLRICITSPPPPSPTPPPLIPPPPDWPNDRRADVARAGRLRSRPDSGAARLVVEAPPTNPRPADRTAVAELLRAAHAGKLPGT